MSASANPYEATLLDDEKPVEEIRFLRIRPRPNYVTGKMIRQATWRMFWSKRWRLIGLGLLQAVLIYLPLILVLIVGSFNNKYLHIDFDIFSTPVQRVVVCGFFGVIVFLCVSISTIITSIMLRLLRSKKKFQKPIGKRFFRLFVTTCHCIFYILICGLLMFPVCILAIASNIAFYGDGSVDVYWLIISCLGMAVSFLFALFVGECCAIGLCYIVDHNACFLAAVYLSTHYTPGSMVAISLSFLVHCILLSLVGVCTLYIGFLIVPGYLYCWLVVTYLLTTGQYKKPTKPETSEW